LEVDNILLYQLIYTPTLKSQQGCADSQSALYDIKGLIPWNTITTRFSRQFSKTYFVRRGSHCTIYS